jgi:hypothetical protein
VAPLVHEEIHLWLIGRERWEFTAAAALLGEGGRWWRLVTAAAESRDKRPSKWKQNEAEEHREHREIEHQHERHEQVGVAAHDTHVVSPERVSVELVLKRIMCTCTMKKTS